MSAYSVTSAKRIEKKLIKQLHEASWFLKLTAASFVFYTTFISSSFQVSEINVTTLRHRLVKPPLCNILTQNIMNAHPEITRYSPGVSWWTETSTCPPPFNYINIHVCADAESVPH